jgi:hypothetical protein
VPARGALGCMHSGRDTVPHTKAHDAWLLEVTRRGNCCTLCKEAPKHRAKGKRVSF